MFYLKGKASIRQKGAILPKKTPSLEKLDVIFYYKAKYYN